MLDKTNITALFEQGSLCPESVCTPIGTGTAVVVTASGIRYTSVRAVCKTCGTRVGVTEGTEGYRRVVVTPGGSRARAESAGRLKQEWVRGTPMDEDAADDADVQATFQAVFMNATGGKSPSSVS